MKVDDHTGELIPPALLAEVEAMAAAEHRAANEVVREAIERYVRERQPLPRVKLTPQEAGARFSRAARVTPCRKVRPFGK